MSTNTKTKIYFIPGMGAGSNSFENIRLPEDKYEVEIIEWQIPEKEEPLHHYAQRMAAKIKAENSVLVGVSFGGVVAQEMEQFLNLKKLVIISSIKKRSELPSIMRWAKKFKLYKALPVETVLSTDDLTKFAIGQKSLKRLELYQEYLRVRNSDYLKWAIKEMVSWDREEPMPGIVHIHGDQDHVFPIKYIDDCIVVNKGTHIMLLTKGRTISRLLIKAIET